MICGHCKGQHEKVAEVKACYEAGKTPEPFVKPAGDAATEKQLAFLTKLVAEKPNAAAHLKATTLLLTKREASRLIDAMIAAPRETKAATPAAAAPTLEDGMYVRDETVIKVYHAVHGSGQQVSKVLRKQADGSWKFDYAGKAGMRGLLPEHRMTEEFAKNFGLVYGICIRCAADLTREESIHVGYGPVCAGHEGWWYPTKTELRSLEAARQEALNA